MSPPEDLPTSFQKRITQYPNVHLGTNLIN